MAKIDTSGIEGYAEMTAEEKLAALEGMEFPEPDYSGYVKKDVFDKKASEAANYKKQLDSKMSDEEKKSAESAEEMDRLRQQVADLQKEKTISVYKAKYLADGYDESLADETARALAESNFDTVFANQKKFIAAHDTELKEKLMDETPGMPGGKGGNEKGEDVMLAERLAKRASEARKAASEGMKRYL